MTPAHLSPDAADLFRQTVDSWQQHLTLMSAQRDARRRQWAERALWLLVVLLWGAWRGGWM